MNLHKEPDLFEEIINRTSEKMIISSAIIEKDYYVSMLLREIVNSVEGIVFRGGTSLSKCYNIIMRFSEDIDLSYDNSKVPLTESERRNLSNKVLDIINISGLDLANKEEVRSRGQYNQYKIDYLSQRTGEFLKEQLLLEIELSNHPFPCEEKEVDSLIYQYLADGGHLEIIKEYNLVPFKIRTQNIERTYIDKVFALCDYYMLNTVREHSRHLYDIHKLHPLIERDTSFKNLVKEVREIRAKKEYALSAQLSNNPIDLLKEIVAREVYKSDYNAITQNLLYEDVSYEETIETIREIIAEGLFNSRIDCNL